MASIPAYYNTYASPQRRQSVAVSFGAGAAAPQPMPATTMPPRRYSTPNLASAPVRIAPTAMTFGSSSQTASPTQSLSAASPAMLPRQSLASAQSQAALQMMLAQLVPPIEESTQASDSTTATASQPSDRVILSSPNLYTRSSLQIEGIAEVEPSSKQVHRESAFSSQVSFSPSNDYTDSSLPGCLPDSFNLSDSMSSSVPGCSQLLAQDKNDVAPDDDSPKFIQARTSPRERTEDVVVLLDGGLQQRRLSRSPSKSMEPISEDHLEIFRQPDTQVPVGKLSGGFKISGSVEWEAELRQIFNSCDVLQTGFVSKVDFLKVCQAQPKVAEFFGVPAKIQQESSNEPWDRFFCDMDGSKGCKLRWEEFRAIFDQRIGSLPPTLVAAATAKARSELDAEFQTRLSALEARMRGASPEPKPDEKEDLLSRLRSELECVADRTRCLTTAVEARYASEGNELAELRREASCVEKAIAQAKEQAQSSQANARQLDASNNRLQNELRKAKASLEEQRQQTREQGVDACEQLKLAASHLEAEAFLAARTTEELCSRGRELEHEAMRLRADKDAALAQLQKQEAARSAQWTRLAAIASVGGPVPKTNTSVTDLAALINREWAEARNRKEQKLQEGDQLRKRIIDLETELSVAREAASHAAEARDTVAADAESVDREQRAHERCASEEMASAQAEHVLLSQQRLEWEQMRPQLTALIEELRAGSRDSNGAAYSLHERMAGLRHAIETQRSRVPSTVAPSLFSKSPSPPSPPRTDLRGNTGSPDRGGSASAGSESDIGSPIAQVRGELFGSREVSDSPGVEGTTQAEGDANIRDDDEPEPLIRKAVEEHDLLHKRVLALEDEKATLIRAQEDLIKFIREKVEPVQKAFGIE